MTINHDDIINLALRYISIDEVTNFPQNNELFCFFERNLLKDKILKDDEGWNFAGYGICIGYEYDLQSKPQGKWIWFSFLSLDSFPPHKQNLKLQPPHIARGLFQTPGRETEIKILNLSVNNDNQNTLKKAKESNSIEDLDNDSNTKILKFPKSK